MKLIKKIIIFIITTNSLYILTGISLCLVIFISSNWFALPVLQKLVGLLFIANTFQEFEEQRSPKGFVNIMVVSYKLPILNLDTTKFIISYLATIVFLLPIFFPQIPWLAFTAVILVFFKTFSHLTLIKLNKPKFFYSPGLLSTVVLMIPISVYTWIYIVENNLMTPAEFLFSILYLLVAIIFAQRLIVTSDGIRHLDYLKNIRDAII